VLGLARAGNMSIAYATARLYQFLTEVDATIVPIDTLPCCEAISEFDRFGRGHNAGALNMGQPLVRLCLRRDTPRLCMGNDFPQTGNVAA
jgi:uncharacterized protein with PIN domain